MPIFEIQCADCHHVAELIVTDTTAPLSCPICGSRHTTKLMSATSSLTGRSGQSLPGLKDTGCCGSHPGQAQGCAGPGSCCGRR
jgi:putative FmdB family regulatory protein